MPEGIFLAILSDKVITSRSKIIGLNTAVQTSAPLLWREIGLSLMSVLHPAAILRSIVVMVLVARH